MNDTLEALREELKDPEYSEGYAESFLDSYIATQIKVLREQSQLSQQDLATLLGTGQGVVSRIENVNYSKWNVSTLKKLARAFRVRLKVSFETYGSLIGEVQAFSREALQRTPRESDPVLYPQYLPALFIASRTKRNSRRVKGGSRSRTPIHRSVESSAFYLPPSQNGPNRRRVGIADSSTPIALRAAS
jgi:transcriptional regulator with XRE-family HTH domain